jgi:hypothetical protein
MPTTEEFLKEPWLQFIMKALTCLAVANSLVLLVLWALQILSLFTLILVYEALFIIIIGISQILSSRIYRKDSVPYRYGGRTAWWNFEKFANLTPEERQRYRQEGLIMIIIGLVLLSTVAVVHIYFLALF